MFVTLEDPRAKVQGSRDPLGVQPIWSRFGREVVCNLTTVSRAVRGFAVTMLGRYFGERLIELGQANEEDAVPIFLRCEQASAYARYVSRGEEGADIVLGITRVKKFLAEHNRRVPIENNSRGFILSDQRTYGLWGLYSVASRVSGLLADGPVGLTELTRDFVDHEYMPKIRPQEKELMKLFRKGGTLTADLNRQPFKSLAKLLGGPLTSGEVAFYRETLRDAKRFRSEGPEDQPRADRQLQLAELIVSSFDSEDGLDRDSIVALKKRANARSYSSLATKLDRILRLEATIAPAEYMFDQIIASNGRQISTLAKKFDERWGNSIPNLDVSLDSCLPLIQQSIDEQHVAQLLRLDHALGSGDYKEAINALIDWNEVVMKNRGSAAWVRRNGSTLDVKYRGRETEMPAAAELPKLWRNSYFIDALLSVCLQLETADGK